MADTPFQYQGDELYLKISDTQKPGDVAPPENDILCLSYKQTRTHHWQSSIKKNIIITLSLLMATIADKTSVISSDITI